MNITTDIKSVTYLKANAAEVLTDLNENRRPLVITQNGEPKAVMQDPESYEAMRNAIGLLRLVAIGEQEIKDGNVTDQDEVFAKLDKLMEKL